MDRLNRELDRIAGEYVRVALLEEEIERLESSFSGKEYHAPINPIIDRKKSENNISIAKSISKDFKKLCDAVQTGSEYDA